MGTTGSKEKRIRIEQAVQTADGHGGHTTTASLRAVVYAHERSLTGREALQAAQVSAVLSSVWEIWFRSDISVKDRIRYKTRVIEIEAVIDPTDTREELHLFCSEVQGA
jgi:SPP1 family predicted phage head-tail adaptor